MRETSAVLFIGGVKDGQEERMPLGQQNACYPKLSEDSSSLFARALAEDFAGYDLANVKYECDFYRRERIRGHERTFDVFLLQGMSPDDMIQALIENYQCPTKSSSPT